MLRSSLLGKVQHTSLIHSPFVRSLGNCLLTSVLMCLMNTLTGLNAEGGGLYVVHFNTVAKSCPILYHPMASLSFTVSRSLLKLMSIELVMPSSHLILFHPFLLLPSVFPSIRVFSSGSALHIRWPKYWSFSFSIVLPMNIQGRFPLGSTGLISLLSKELSRVFSNTTVQKHQFFSA